LIFQEAFFVYKEENMDESNKLAKIVKSKPVKTWNTVTSNTQDLQKVDGINREEVELDEVLNIQQREKRRQIIRRYEAKIERSRELSRKKMAPEKNIKKRAYAQARQIVRKRVAGQRGAEYEKLGPSEKMAIDRAVDTKTKLIKKLAARLLPRVKQAEQKRLALL